jgi:hypothetical protein
METQEKFDRANHLLKVCRLKLMNIAELRLYGCVIYKFHIEIIESDEMPTAVFSFINNVPTILLNVDFVCQLNSVLKLQFVLIHELMHFLNQFFSRVKDKDPKIYNLAQDHVINNILIQDSMSVLRNYIQPPDPDSKPFIINEIKDDDLTSEEVYGWLMQEKVTQYIIDTDSNSITIKFPGKPEETYDLDYKAPDKDINSGDNTEQDKNIENIVNEIKAEIRAAIDNNLCNQRGATSSKLFEFIDKITTVEIPWDRIVENCINSTMTVSPDNRSWKYINKRMAYHGFLMPSKGMIEKKDNLYIVVDTSASISSKDLSKFCDIIEKSLGHFENIKIIQHDTKVTHVDELNQSDFIARKNDIFKMYGRGGTSHDDAFKLIEEDYVESSPIGMILSLTDYESDIESIWNKFKWKDEIPFKLILNKNHKVNPIVDRSPIIIK